MYSVGYNISVIPQFRYIIRSPTELPCNDGPFTCEQLLQLQCPLSPFFFSLRSLILSFVLRMSECTTISAFLLSQWSLHSKCE